MYPAAASTEGGAAEGNPLFRTFSSDHSVVLGNGERVELTTATDPISGETSKVEVSLEVLKK